MPGWLTPLPPERPWKWTGRSRRLLVGIGAALVLLLMVAPFVAKRIVLRVARQKIEARFGPPVEIGWLRLRWKGIELGDIVLGQSGRIDRVTVRGDEITVERPQLQLNPELVRRLRGSKKADGQAGGSSSTGRRLHVADGQVAYRDPGRNVSVTVGRVEAELEGKTGRVVLARVEGRFPFDVVGSVGEVDVQLANGKPSGLKLRDAAVGIENLVRVTRVSGSVLPEMALSGSLGTLTQPLWQARGGIDLESQQIDVLLSADPVPLDVLRPLWMPSVGVGGGVGGGAPQGSGSAKFMNLLIAPELARVGGEVSVRTAGGDHNRIDLQGHAEVTGLSVGGQALGKQPMRNLAIAARFGATVFPRQRRFELGRAVLKHVGAELAVAGELDLGGPAPKLAMHIEVPKAPCQTVLGALPRPFVPAIADFKLEGMFDTNVTLKVDMADLQSLVLDGHVGIDGCKVLSAPYAYSAERLMAPFDHRVEVEQGYEIDFSIGNDNPEFASFADISPHIPNALMTTEDNAFFRHHGFVTSEFRTALVRNLEQGAFRLGASSITMQTVKNVLLGREKTLSRKLQELFLTWYLEQHLPKERIFEIYLNAIEFGPGVYGIGRAMRHYFGKTPAQAGPKEAAFFSSILPSPKRRYVHYCNGQLTDKWEQYVARIMRRMRDRGRLSEEEYSQAIASKLVFDRTEAKPVKECLEYVKRLTEGGPKDEERDVVEAGATAKRQ